MAEILGSIAASMLGGLFGGDSKDSGGGGGQVVQATPTDMSSFMGTVLDHFAKVETWDKGTVIRGIDSDRTKITGLIQALGLQSPRFTKVLAQSDSQEAVQEVIDNAATAFGLQMKKVANYEIPRLATALEASGSYESTCAQLLECDVASSIDLSGVVNDAAMVKLRTVEAYAKIDKDYAGAMTDSLGRALESTETRDLKKTVENGLAIDNVGDIAGMLAIQTIMGWAMTNLWSPFLPKGSSGGSFLDSILGGTGGIAGAGVAAFMGAILPSISDSLNNSDKFGDLPKIPPLYGVDPLSALHPSGPTFKTEQEMLQEMLPKFEADMESCNDPAINKTIDDLRKERRVDNSEAMQYLAYLKLHTVDADQLVHIDSLIAKIEDNTCDPEA